LTRRVLDRVATVVDWVVGPVLTAIVIFILGAIVGVFAL
jgi:hypothetical protein